MIPEVLRWLHFWSLICLLQFWRFAFGLWDRFRVVGVTFLRRQCPRAAGWVFCALLCQRLFWSQHTEFDCHCVFSIQVAGIVLLGRGGVEGLLIVSFWNRVGSQREFFLPGGKALRRWLSRKLLRRSSVDLLVDTVWCLICRFLCRSGWSRLFSSSENFFLLRQVWKISLGDFAKAGAFFKIIFPMLSGPHALFAWRPSSCVLISSEILR